VTLTSSALGVIRLAPTAKIPEKAHEGDLGLDLFALERTELWAGTVTLVRTGIACNFPVGVGALIRDRSSVATKRQLFVVAGVIDAGYTGEIKVAFHNINYETQVFEPGDKIAQMILTPVITVPIIEQEQLQDTTRGTGGFGSSGK
jgi:dUTP pyrophosphatase